MTPTLSYRYVPLINPLVTGNFGVDQSEISYSSYERSLYSVGNSAEASFLSFAVNNTFELKLKSNKDTVTGFKKVRIIDQLSLAGNYDFLKDSMNLSNITMNLRISPKNWLNVVTNATFSPYAWDSLTGKTQSDYAVQNKQGLGRFLSVNFSTRLVLAPKKDREKIQEETEHLNDQWNADFNYFALHPEHMVFFDIPWKINLSHIYSIKANQNVTEVNPDPFIFVQSLSAQGDISFTKRWNLSGNLNFNIVDRTLSNANFSLNRNMHCWALSIFWTPVGGNQSFLVSIRNTSAIFSDAKIEFRKPPAFL